MGVGALKRAPINCWMTPAHIQPSSLSPHPVPPTSVQVGIRAQLPDVGLAVRGAEASQKDIECVLRRGQGGVEAEGWKDARQAGIPAMMHVPAAACSTPPAVANPLYIASTRMPPSCMPPPTCFSAPVCGGA